MNIVVIMMDSFRPDHVGAQGSTICRTPALDRFAQRATVFEKAYQASFPTVPTRADMFTGRHVFPFLSWQPLPRDWPVLQQILSDEGFLTQMVIDTPHIIAHGFYYQRGFHSYHWVRGQESDVLYADPDPDEVPLPAAESKIRGDGIGMRRGHYRNRLRWQYERDRFAPRTMSLAMDWLEHNHRRGPFYLYVDTFDPHEPWDAPDWYLRLYADPEFKGDCADYPCYRRAEHFLDAAETRHLDAMYSAEATMVDRWVGLLIEQIERLGIADDTAIFVMSDHGFFLGDHGFVGKLNMYPADGGPYPKYDPLIRTVMVARLPGQTTARRSNALVQPCDLAPTILDLLGIERPPSFDAPSFAPVLRGQSDSVEGREVAVTTQELLQAAKQPRYLGINDGAWTLNVAPGQPTILNHTAVDPGQEHNLLSEHPDEARRLWEACLRLLVRLNTPEEKIAAWRDGVQL